MKRFLLVVIALAVTVRVTSAAEPRRPEMKSVQEKASYSIGFNIGSSLKTEGADLDLALLFEGLRDALQSRPSRLSPQEVQSVMTAFQEEMRKRQAARAKVEGERNAKQGASFLAANKKQPGVVTLPSGLQYKVVKKGTGAMPTAQDTVRTHYRGTLIDGKEFDSSYARGEPAEFPVGGVISGWTEALQRMQVGSKWILYVPSSLGYSARGAGDDIGANATLIFEIELLGIVK